MLKRRSRFWTRLFFIGGVLLLAKGSFSVYPYLFSSNANAEIVVHDINGPAQRFEPGSYLFRLSLPRQGVDLNVVEGTTNAALRKGPGHLEGSPLPGAVGNSVIAGHRDTHFRILKDISIGDELWIEIGRKQLVYRVVDTSVVSPDDTRPLRPESGEVLTLVTCYPFYYIGPAPKRFIVRAAAID